MLLYVQKLHFQFRQAIFLAGLSEVLEDEGAGPALTYLQASMNITAEVRSCILHATLIYWLDTGMRPAPLPVHTHAR